MSQGIADGRTHDSWVRPLLFQRSGLGARPVWTIVITGPVFDVAEDSIRPPVQSGISRDISPRSRLVRHVTEPAPVSSCAENLNQAHCLDLGGGKVGVGLILPALLDIAPLLVPLAASGLALYMAGAGTERLRRAEYKLLIGDVVFLAAMLFLAWGRFGPESFLA